MEVQEVKEPASHLDHFVFNIIPGSYHCLLCLSCKEGWAMLSFGLIHMVILNKVGVSLIRRKETVDVILDRELVDLKHIRRMSRVKVDGNKR